jgi:3-phenylpropionate/trans-cinnamate dioxygenase ferredoxin subunit
MGHRALDPDADAGNRTTRWVAAGPLSELADDTAVHADLDGRPICLARSGGTVYALLDQCSHQDVALSEGEVEDGFVACWMHGSEFDLTTGRPNGPPAVRPVPVYPVRVVAGSIEVELH